jgi:hypothetical protein
LGEGRLPSMPQAPTDRTRIRRELLARLKRIAAPRYQRLEFTDDTEIYYDPCISGMDMFDLPDWIAREFHVEFNIDLGEYTPPEGWDPWILRNWRLRRRQYKSLTLGRVLTAIESGVWHSREVAEETLVEWGFDRIRLLGLWCACCGPRSPSGIGTFPTHACGPCPRVSGDRVGIPLAAEIRRNARPTSPVANWKG